MIRKIAIIPLIFFVLFSGCVSETVPENGSLQFTSSPVGAQIYLDSQFRGNTPSLVTGVEPGNHTLEFRYPGYESWSTSMVVSTGSNNVFATLQPLAGSSQAAVTTTTVSSASPVTVTMTLNKELMIVGDSMIITGTATGCKNVLLTMYGSGSYENGIILSPPDVSALDTWSYTWNPGSKLMSGTYTIIATDPDKKVTVKKSFSVVGGGEVTVISNSYSAAKGDILRFSGICTTNAPYVQLVLYGPDRYAGGVELGTFSVQADKNWNFKYSIEATMPTGQYTMYVYDVPKTASNTVQFTVGYKQ